MGICGFGNQLLGFKEACIIAKYTNRTMISPIFIPHGTIRNQCKPYYQFKEIFNMEMFKNCVDIVDFTEIDKKYIINCVYNIRHENENNLTSWYYNAQKKFYNIGNVQMISLKKIFFTNVESLDEIKNIKDDIIVILGTFNTIKLSTCMKNGCLNENCGFHSTFIDDYNNISKHLIFNDKIEQISKNTLKKNDIDINNLCVFHMRVLDLCQNKTFEYAYNNYNEEKVFYSICSYLYEIGEFSLIQNIFLIAPIQFTTINNLHIFNSNKIKRIDSSKFSHDPFIFSIMELYICEQAKVFITSPTNTPNESKEHTRSSFTMNAKTIRDLSGNYKYDKCINKIYEKTHFTIKKYNINPNQNKKVISFSLYNNKDIYNYGVFVNYELKKLYFKEWIMRLYIDSTTNQNLKNYVIKHMKDVEVIEINSKLPPMCYRFFIYSDKNVNCFISRDLDSIITPREEYMVNEWLLSDKSLHLIHEVLPGHRMKIMGGMFGFKDQKKNINDDSYFYQPWGGTCSVEINGTIKIYRDNDRKKNFFIPLENMEQFYKKQYVKCEWSGIKNKVQAKLQDNGDIHVKHENNRVYIFYKQEDKNNDLLTELYKFYIDKKRFKFTYNDDQCFLEIYFSQYLNKKYCLDHNKNMKWDYSEDVDKPYNFNKGIVDHIKDFPFSFVGHRITNMKEFYLKNFSKLNIEL